jgi:NAD(P)-dependent dehydrogenase (short-subunit alcohol dehydrogenase family)
MKNAVVTGAGSGIGRAFALEIARRGGRVVCADIDLASAKETVRLVEAGGGQALAVECDVSAEEQIVGLADRAEEWFGGPVRLVVNNAGIGAGGSVVGETPMEDWRRTLGVNLWGVVHGCHVFAPRLAAGGGIINVASAASFTAAPRMAPYNVSKAGVLALSETLAAEGVRVSVLCPTFVKTNIVAAGLIDERSARLAERAMRWIGFSPERVARIALDAHAKGRLYVLPQIDARVLWRLKRAAPAAYTRTARLIERIGG